MDTLLNDIFHAQPYALLVIAGLVFLAIAIVGSVKTYFDPGKNGRIAAGAVGALLLIIGLFMYKAAPAPPSTSASDAVAQAPKEAQEGTTSACFVPGKWPSDLYKQMKVGDVCTNAAGQQGRAVAVNPVCTYTSGPATGTSQQLNHLMYVGYNCTSRDQKSRGSVLPVAIRHN